MRGTRVIDREPECVLGRVDDQLRSELKSEFQRLLVNSRGQGNQILSDMYANYGVRSAQLTLKKSRFKNR